MSLYDILYGDVIPNSGTDVTIGRNQYDYPSPVVPTYDVHLRKSVHHDTAASGNLGYFGNPEYLYLFPDTSGIRPVQSAVYIDASQTSNLTLNIISSPSIVRFESTNAISDSSHFEITGSNSEDLRFWVPGTYEITFKVCPDISVGTTRYPVGGWLEGRGIGGTYVEIPGTRFWGLIRDATNGECTLESSLIFENVAAGNELRIVCGLILGASPAGTYIFGRAGTGIQVRKMD